MRNRLRHLIIAMLVSWYAMAQIADETPAAVALRVRRVDAENRALFQSTDTLSLTLTTNFGAVTNDRDPESTKAYPGVIQMTDPNKGAIEIPVQVSARGNLRRRDCEFVPLRIAFPHDAAQGTPFEMRGASLKLVTHCRNSTEYEQFILREYLAYRLSNLVTAGSFRTRLARITYVDSAKRKTLTIRYAIFIEDDDDVARRLGGKIVDKQFHLNQLHPVALLEMTLFEFMIGDTDYSIFGQHNVRVVEAATGLVYPIPYDFDVSGLVNVPYAIPDPRLHLQYLTDRLYRGPCRTPQQLQPFLNIFRLKKPDVLAAVESVPDLTPLNRRQASRFLEGFFSLIDRPSRVKRNVIDTCLKSVN
jgi:hypothetical protein